MADRNDGYGPRPTHEGGNIRPTFSTIVGNPSGPRAVRTMPVALGSADEYNDKQSWWWAQVDDGTGDHKEHWSRFDGWYVRVGVDLHTWNEREVNDWKGRDEIRKEGYWKITFNEQIVYGGYANRDVLESLLTIRRKIQELEALPIDWREDVDYRTLIEGRKIYYKTTPAELGYWMPDQGAVMAKALPGHTFPRSAYDIDASPDSLEHDYSSENATETKIDLLSPDIWWWRDRG
jgi:hypothetical protein